MSIVTTDDQHYYDIANAIRSKTGGDTVYYPSEMAAAIEGLTVGSGIDVEIIPDGYSEHVTRAKELYTGDYSGMIISDCNSEYIGVIFMLSNFSIESYTEGTTWYSMKGAVYCKYTAATQQWEMLDYTSAASTEEHFTRYIVYSTRILYYNGAQIYPLIGSARGGQFPISATGWTFEYEIGNATTEINSSMFTTQAVGILEE